MKNIFNIITVIILVGCSSSTSIFKLTHHRVGVELFQFENQLAYIIKKADQVIIDTSLLGIIVNNEVLGKNVNIELSGTKKVQIDYTLYGAKNKASYKGELTHFEIQEKDGFKWFLEFQLSDEGVAFRYKIPKDGTNNVSGELTSFRLPDKTKIWYFERNNDWKLKSHAGEWLSADISIMPEVSQMGPIQGLTLTCDFPDGGYALIAESALYNYSGMRLEAIGNNTFQANFTEGQQGFNIAGNIASPWRCILLADDLNALVNNTLVASLNPPPDPQLFQDQSWIKPGKSVWHWWTGKHATFEEEIIMVDHAAALGFGYSMVDEGWELWDNKWQATKELCEYAKGKGVGIFLWKHSAEINFPKNEFAVMTGFLDSVKQTGAVGVKVDFMNGQTKSIIEFDETLLWKAAERQLMVNFHGCQQSSGEYRTYPNEVTREGIRGLELNQHKEGPLTASHNAALPFTRLVTGHGDYTPLGFTSPGPTTWAHQLATLICFYSPFQCIAEGSDFLLENRKIQPALDFIKQVPPVWDETIVLPESQIGQLALIARRKDNDWYLGVLNGGDETHLELDCDFLGLGEYQAEIFSDDTVSPPINIEGLHPRNTFVKTVIPFNKQDRNCNENTRFHLDLAKHGGAAIWFKSSIDQPQDL